MLIQAFTTRIVGERNLHLQVPAWAAYPSRQEPSRSSPSPEVCPYSRQGQGEHPALRQYTLHLLPTNGPREPEGRAHAG